MEINRRRLLQLLVGTPLLSSLPVAAQQARILIASAADTADGSHLLVVMDELGSSLLRHPLPDRAHHVAAHPSKPWVAAVARRPGYYIDLVDYTSGQLQQRIEPQPGRHFYGHAIFTRDGQGLWVTEMDMASGEGRVTLRNLATPQQPVRDFSSGGIGPHELLLAPDASTLVVANGGILTDGRDKLNIDSMTPSLAYIDQDTGRLLEQRFLPHEDHQLSIRHIDINSRGEVIIALQYQGDIADDKPLVALHRRGSELRLLKAPTEINRQMAQYCGSARFDSSGRIAAVSAPRGNLITFWDVDNSRYLTSLKAADGCGLAATEEPEVFIASSGRGHCYTLYPREEYREPLRLPPQLSSLAWDNHMMLFQAKA
ncbi:hypothetical protein GCM10011352_41120 [Marinobacterium zhoushanense]|uniref:DUF1513 domain-containing protein n=1 Tax=Marinobacterium zhoushanense TaxID=1679163 RepID=A0ABQ1KZE4_9GAMM|nr:DUF1513 domain-containing protein [Marinobacterium zhoushanense]GGC10411.1 hypothetical protein GCM10011352_41120 [Marinobacterium zhoushanense]